MRYLQVSSRPVWRWVAQGKPPQPLKLRRRMTRWSADRVLEAVAALGGEV